MESKLNFVSLLEGTKEGIASNLRLLIYMLILHFVEAAYASSLRRARIPLLVDPDYTAEGWLALMTAGDYHYDFVRKPFETKIVELIQELERRCVPSGEDKMDGITKQESVTKQPDAHVTSSHGIQLIVFHLRTDRIANLLLLYKARPRVVGNMPRDGR